MKYDIIQRKIPDAGKVAHSQSSGWAFGSWPGSRFAEPESRETVTATRCRFKFDSESIWNSKTVRSSSRRPRSINLKNAVLATKYHGDMMHNWYDAASFAFKLVSRGRPRGRPRSNNPKPWYNVDNAVIPIEPDSTEASQWLGKKSRVISGISLWGLICCLRLSALVSEHCPKCPPPLCKLWGAETHD
jgi:hypothetical protein